MNKRCCLCRAATGLESTTLPGDYRCADRVGCKRRQRATIKAHFDLAAVCDDVPSQP